MESNSTPLYRQIANNIREEIKKSPLRVGEAIPSEMKLAKKYDVSRVTIRQSIDILVNEGLLYRVKGSGTYLKKPKIEHNIYKLQGFIEEIQSQNRKYVNKIIEFKIHRVEDHIGHILKLDKGEQVFFVSRIRYVDSIPAIVEYTYLPVKLFPDLSYEIMLSSKYEYIEVKKGFKIKESYQEFIPILPDKKMQDLLSIEENTPILKVVMNSVLDSDLVFEYTELYFRTDQYRFSIVAKR